MDVSVLVDEKRLVDMRDREEERMGRDVRRVRNKGFDITNVWPTKNEGNRKLKD